MKTNSIIDILELYFGRKDNYSEEEYNYIDNLTINRFDISGKINNIAFEELLILKNLKSLTINNCLIDNDIMSIILNITKLENLSLYNCEFVDNPESFFQRLNIKTLVIDNTMFDLCSLEFLSLNTLVLSNIDINRPFILNLNRLDIRKSELKDYTFLNGNIGSLIISESQYQSNDNLTNYIGNIIIMEDNGEMLKEEVNK